MVVSALGLPEGGQHMAPTWILLPQQSLKRGPQRPGGLQVGHGYGNAGEPLSVSAHCTWNICVVLSNALQDTFSHTPGLHPWDTSHTTLQTMLIRHGLTSVGPKSPAGMPGVSQGWYSPDWLVHARPAGTPPQPPQPTPQHTCRSRCHLGTRSGRPRSRASFPHALTVTANSVLPFTEQQAGPRWRASRGGDTVSGRCNAFTKHLLVVCGRPLLSGFMLRVPSHKRAGISVVTRQKLLNGEPRAFW